MENTWPEGQLSYLISTASPLVLVLKVLLVREVVVLRDLLPDDCVLGADLSQHRLLQNLQKSLHWSDGIDCNCMTHEKGVQVVRL